MVKYSDRYLAHFGKKGMKWGVRKSDTPSSDDAARVGQAKAKAKSGGGTKALSNKELQDVITRMNLERQYKTLNPSKAKKTLDFVTSLLALGNTVNQVLTFVNSPAGKAVKDAIIKR